MEDAPIVRLIQRYFPDWTPPKPQRGKWASCLCPFHGDTNKSASISMQYNAFHCFVCGVKGDVIKIIRDREEVTFAEAKRIAEELSEGSDRPLPTKPARQSRRRVFGDKGSGDNRSERTGQDRQVHAGVRGRSTPWS
ncbi:CHC2 zinc finger domain-containing protein [Mycobacteroides abscessus]|uniref:CHC2 zinc finger domain-containing protein n=1 Tax=Mycobacteroides abscessus TaxID=36809 RepID=UPI0009AB9C6F